jgi:hypothetical protein
MVIPPVGWAVRHHPPHHRADGSAGRSCSMLSLSQAGRLVLGSDLNRSESSWDAPPAAATRAMSAIPAIAIELAPRLWTHAMCESQTQSTAANELDGRHDFTRTAVTTLGW